MPDTGAPWNLPSPQLPDQPNGPSQISELAASVAAALGRAYPCTSVSRPDPVAGLVIFETDTQILSVCNDGTNWQPVWFPQVWISPASPYSNGWVAYSATFHGLGYWKDPFGIVHLRGLIKLGTAAATVYTLPDGYRPLLQTIFSQISSVGGARVDVFPTGAIQVVNYFSGGVNSFVSLEGITFGTT
jgi:hypothetical protein